MTAEHRYSQRRDWQEHTVNAHHTGWCCPYGCDSIETTYAKLQYHLSGQHGISKMDASLHILCKSHARSLKIDEGLTCHLCGKQEIDRERWFKHMSWDLQQLALHAVPKSLMSTESDDEVEATTDRANAATDTSHPVEERSHASQDSSLSESGENEITEPWLDNIGSWDKSQSATFDIDKLVPGDVSDENFEKIVGTPKERIKRSYQVCRASWLSDLQVIC